MRRFAPASLLTVVLVAVARHAGGQPATPPASAEAHPAPNAEAAHSGQPPEAQLTPPPDAEKAAVAPGLVLIRNPAFPSAEPASPPPEAAKQDPGRAFAAADLAPYFAEGALADAKAAFDAGEFERARSLLQRIGNKTYPVRYLAAVAALRSGHPDVAAEELRPLLGTREDPAGYAAVRDRVLVHAALADEDLEKWGEAAELYKQVPQGSKLYVDARFGLYRVARRLGLADAAREALEPLSRAPAPMWGRDVGAEALIALADLAHEEGAKDAERSALIDLYSRHPLSPLAVQAGRRLHGNVPLEGIVTRAENLIEAHRNEQGMAALEPYLKSLPLAAPLGCRAHLAYGKALRKQREHTRAIQELTPVVEACRDPDLRPRALYVLASSQSIVDLAHGPATYETLARDYPTHSFADDALFYAADLYLKNGDPKSALARLDEISRRYAGGDFLGEALFKSFWILRGLGNRAEAYAALDRIEKTFAQAKETYDVERAQYWRARMLEADGKRDQAAALFERLAIDHPVTYYGLMSRDRLGSFSAARTASVAQKLAAPRETVVPWPLHAGAIGADPHLAEGIELLRLGFGDAASAELLAINRTQLPPEPLRLIVQALALSGDAKSAHAIARTELRDDLSGPIRPDTRSVWEVAYPDAFRSLIEKHCREAKLDPDLLQALMREESALDPKALSWAGALGLTQLMLSTAKSVARSVPDIKRVTPQLLLQPDPNIHLGAAHLGALLKRFDGNKAYAVASYNAGTSMVDRWLSQKGTKELDEWVEEIPIAETRGYVKRVLRSYNTYQLLYGRGVPRVIEAAAPAKPAAEPAEKKTAPAP